MDAELIKATKILEALKAYADEANVDIGSLDKELIILCPKCLTVFDTSYFACGLYVEGGYDTDEVTVCGECGYRGSNPPLTMDDIEIKL